jgi:ribonuclease Z
VTKTYRVFIAIALVAGAAGAAFMNRGAIGVALMRRTAARTILSDTIATLPDGLHVVLCGTDSPFPSTTRSGPCTAVIAGDRLFIVDAGRGAASVIVRMGLQTARINAVLMTHYHADHVDGLGQLAETRWLAGSAKTPLGVIGPVGLEQVVAGFNEAYGLNKSYRIAVDGAELAARLVSGWRHAPSRFRPDKHQPSFSSKTDCGSPRSTSTMPSAAPPSDTGSTTKDEAWRSVVTRPNRRISSASRAELTC